MRPLTFEEREDLVRRAGSMDVVDFVHQIEYSARKTKLRHAQVLAVLLRAPRPTDLPKELLLLVRRCLAEKGSELTPAEAVQEVELCMAKLRNCLRGKGAREDEIPDSDVALLETLR